jgi:hypothetical protein
MRHPLSIALALGIAAAAATAQPGVQDTPPPEQATDPPPIPAHLAPPPHSKLIGLPITPPPVTSWPVGEPVTEFQPGTIYVISRHARIVGFGSSLAPQDLRHFLGGLQAKFGGAVVVVEVIDRDGRHSTVANTVVESVKDNPDVRTRIGICNNSVFDRWCGQSSRAGHSISAVIDGNGVLAAVVRSHQALPLILDQLLAGTFDSEEYLRRDDAVWNIQVREPRPNTMEARLAQLDEMLAVTPGSRPGLSHAKRLLDLDRSEEAIAVVRGILASMTVPDRDLLKDLLGLDDIVRDPSTGLYTYNQPVLAVQLDAAKLLAATSDMQNRRDLSEVVNIARRMRDYDTAIMYQTMIIALATEDLDQYTQTRLLRELEDEAKSKK